MKRLKQLPEFVRFVMVGIFATALHYGLYFVLQRVINVNIGMASPMVPLLRKPIIIFEMTEVAPTAASARELT